MNAKKPIIIEVIGTSGKKLDADALIDISTRNGLNDPETFQWKNHLVVYGKIKDDAILEKQVQAKFPDDTVNVYRDLFYQFNRQRCDSPKIAAEWENIILTANLVKDSDMQKEYLDYHATQFEKWPEVAEGFCHAQFQQLLLFRNERQLMLVISIPKGTSLDELNPKTSEDNPRVDEWNALMKKYQEGIPGTTRGEIWAFFKPVAKE